MVNAQVADPSLSLEIPQGAQLSVHAPEIVDLHQIQPVGPQGAERIVDPLEAFLAVFAIHLGGHKQLIPDPQFRYQVPDQRPSPGSPCCPRFLSPYSLPYLAPRSFFLPLPPSARRALFNYCCNPCRLR